MWFSTLDQFKKSRRNRRSYVEQTSFPVWFSFRRKNCPICNGNRTEWSPIRNGNRTEWSPIRSVIIRVINKIGRPRSVSPICLITSMITDRIGRHKVLLPINHNFNKICDIIGYFLNQSTRNSKFCFASSEKKSHLSAGVMARTVQLLRHDAYCPIKLSN